MDNTNDYTIDGISVLLNKDCVLERYYPLIPFKEHLIHNLIELRYNTKSTCQKLSDEILIDAGLPDNLISLFGQFLCLYDCKITIKDIPDADQKNTEELLSLIELMHLPGVKAVRAQLYYHCGYRHLSDIAKADAVTMRERIAIYINRDKLTVSLPFPKELRTQIAVAKVFTFFSVEHSDIS